MAKATMVISAFDLSEHEHWSDRRDRLHKMWQTGAETIVSILQSLFFFITLDLGSY